MSMKHSSSSSRPFLEEHYILQNIGSFIIPYLAMWLAAIGLACLASYFIDIPYDASVTKTFAVSTTTLSITTITFALPTCMRTIFAAYEQYHSTRIRAILMERFPITLLSLSSFTSLIVSMVVVSGIVGTYTSFPSWSVLVIVLFWALICVFYLFCAIEKLVHFVVKAPGAVLDKLKFNIYEIRSLDSDELYDEFRENLSSMSDVAATIIRNSTGKDAIILKHLNRLREIHRFYAVASVKAEEADNRQLLRRHQKACFACVKELTKLYREAVNNHNGDMTRAILKSYCYTVRDCIEVGVSRNYITEMIAQIHRFQSYSQVSNVPEIEEEASIGWFFLMLLVMKGLDTKNDNLVQYAKHCIVRELLTTLRRATINKDEETLLFFVRTASNSDLNIDLDLRTNEWLALLDRTTLLYLNWLLKTKPEGVEECLNLLRRYSVQQVRTLRPLFCDSVLRLKELLKLERFSDKLSRQSSDFMKQEVDTAAMMDLPLDIDGIRFLCYLVELSYVNVDNEELLENLPRLAKVRDRMKTNWLEESKVPSNEREEFDAALKLAVLACPDEMSFKKYF